MRHKTLEVWYRGKKAAVLFWNEEKQRAAFKYEDDFLKEKWDLSPLLMPIAESEGKVYEFPENKNASFHSLPGLVADALPDNYGTIRSNLYFKALGRKETDINPLERLAFVGKRAMGALEFLPALQIKRFETCAEIDLPKLICAAQETIKDETALKELLKQEDDLIYDTLKVVTSAGGAKPKAIVALNAETKSMLSGQTDVPKGYEHWLLKFDGGKFLEHHRICGNPKGIGKIEYAYYLMAKACNIDMTECKLLEDGDLRHFMTKRFDRTKDGKKIHAQTLSGIAHLDRDKANSYEDLFSVMQRLSLPLAQIEQMYRRMVFNIVARNHDDHAKNHAFLLNEKGQWELSPAYDLCYSYNPEGKYTKNHQMSLNGKNEDFLLSDLSLQAARLSLPHEGKPVIEEVVSTVADWKKFAKEAEVDEKYVKEIQQNLLLLA